MTYICKGGMVCDMAGPSDHACPGKVVSVLLNHILGPDEPGQWAHEDGLNDFVA